MPRARRAGARGQSASADPVRPPVRPAAAALRNAVFLDARRTAENALKLRSARRRREAAIGCPFTSAELEALAAEVRRALRPGGLCVFTVRNTSDPDHVRGIHRGEDLFENQGFIVHFFDRAKVERVANGWDLVGVEAFEEGKLPRRLFRVSLRKPAP